MSQLHNFMIFTCSSELVIIAGTDILMTPTPAWSFIYRTSSQFQSQIKIQFSDSSNFSLGILILKFNVWIMKNGRLNHFIVR